MNEKKIQNTMQEESINHIYGLCVIIV